MKVIFLDIDGVLNCYNKGEKWSERKDRVPMIHDDLVERLNGIISRTGASMVLSSTWRHAEDWRTTMLQAGIANVFLGRTPSFRYQLYDWQNENPGKSAIEFCQRGREIDEWLSINPYGVTRYCIIDDDRDMLPHQRLFRTDGMQGGLTQKIADQVVEFLNGG